MADSPITLDMPEKTLERILDRKIRPLHQTIDELRESMSFISRQFDDLNTKQKNLSQEMENVKKENKQLKAEVLNLSHGLHQQQWKLDELEEYSGRDCVEIRGIPQDPHRKEDTNEIVQKVS